MDFFTLQHEMHQRSLANYAAPSSKEFHNDCIVEDLSMTAEPEFKRQRIESVRSEDDPDLKRGRDHLSDGDDDENDDDEAENENPSDKSINSFRSWASIVI